MRHTLHYSILLVVILSLFSIAMPTEDLIIGESFVGQNASPEEIEMAKKQAMVDLMNQIQVNIKSEFVNEVTETSNSLSEYTSSKINVITDMQIEGIRYNIFKKDKTKVIQAILYKSEAAGLYQERILRLNEELGSQIKQALDFTHSNQNEKALQATFEASKTFNKIEQSIMLYLILGGTNRQEVRPPVSRSGIDSVLYLITETNITSFNDVITNLCFQISKQIPGNQAIAIFPFNYEKTSFFSELSDYTRQKIESNLTKFLQFKLLSPEEPGSLQKVFNITGSYWPRNGSIEFISIINDGNGQTTGSARVTFPEKYVTDLKISIKPQNFVEAYGEDKYFAKNEIIYGDLKISFWTNKGDKNLIFRENEEMKLYVRANTPCYIRFIYYLANGIRTPLYKSYYINETMVNKVIELPESFICAPPFGVEKLQLIASTRELPLLITEKKIIDGEEYEVLSEDIQKFLANTRGFIKNKTQKTKMAERVITLTTMAK